MKKTMINSGFMLLATSALLATTACDDNNGDNEPTYGGGGGSSDGDDGNVACFLYVLVDGVKFCRGTPEYKRAIENGVKPIFDPITRPTPRDSLGV